MPDSLLAQAKDAIRRGNEAAREMEVAGQGLKGRVNVYACTPPLMPVSSIRSGCGYWIVTIDRHTGVTPMFVKCGHCGGMATSRMYKVGPGLQPTHEWFRPAALREFPENYRGPQSLDHVARGGLLLRPLGKKDEWLKPTPETQAFVEEEQRRLRQLMGAGDVKG